MDGRELDYDVRKQLQTLSKDTAELVARHLVMAGRLMDEEPEAALAHARAARALAGRVGAVREANGLVAYTAGEWAEALTELRTARRITGDPEHLAVMADCERALGRPDRALMVAEDPQAVSLSPAAKLELLIVSSGARRDMGQAEAAVVSLQVAALEGPVRPWTARLRYAYADALLDAGRTEDARLWFGRTADADEDGSTDAVERMLELDGVVLEDLGDLEEPEEGDGNQDDMSTSAELQRIAQDAAAAGSGATRSSGGGEDAAPASAEVAPADGARVGGRSEGGFVSPPGGAENPPEDMMALDLARASNGPVAAFERALRLSEQASRATGLAFSSSASEASPREDDEDQPLGWPAGAAPAESESLGWPSQFEAAANERPGPTVSAGPAFVEPVAADDAQGLPDESDDPDLRLFD